MGEVYRLSKRGLNADQIARQLGVATSNFVSNCRTTARALLEGQLPNGPSAARQVASFARRAAADPSLSAAGRTYMSELLSALDQAAGVPSARTPPSVPNRPDRVDTPSLRRQVDDELRARTRRVISRIERETDLQPDDYATVLTAPSPLDRLGSLVLRSSPSRTFMELLRLQRLDLSLESSVVSWGEDLPLSSDLVEQARGRLEYFGDSGHTT